MFLIHPMHVDAVARLSLPAKGLIGHCYGEIDIFLLHAMHVEAVARLSLPAKG
ncbi:hypothetical protein AH4AK4_0543 [Aeromonas hydrophila 4AK4]|nr:hypothetical protein AH4AK4_0543 [Aeromonas hydrophila 4AK4]